jgi:type IV secretion system protein VirB10
MNPEVPSTHVVDEPDVSPAPPTIRERRAESRLLFSRHVQSWIMVGLALLILGIILVTGQTTPAPVSLPSVAPRSTPVGPERVKSYQDRLAEQELRLREEQARAALPTPAMGPPTVMAEPPLVKPVPTEIGEAKPREDQSLLADNVAFTRRDDRARGQVSVTPANAAPPFASPADKVSAADAATSRNLDRSSASVPAAADVPMAETRAIPETLHEGAVIETVLLNRLDGTFEGPVQCLVTSPVFTRDRRAILIPAGSRVLGSAAPVRTWGEARLAVRFHRLLLPDGRAVALENAAGLNEIGETGLKDVVNRHYWQVFGASMAIGAIAGLAQVGAHGGLDQDAWDASRQSAGSSLATSTARVLDRYLNVLPTITIREGHRVLVVLTHDLSLPLVSLTPSNGGRS